MATATTKNAVLLRLTPEERKRIKNFWHRHQFESESQAVRTAIEAGIISIDARSVKK